MERETFKDELKAFASKMLNKYFPTKEKFMDAKLADGTLVSYDAEMLATGVIVYLIDTNGSKLPMPKGSYVMEDGTTFEIVDDLGTADNVVVGPEQPETPEATPVMPEEQAAAPQARTSATGEPIPTSVVETRTKETKFSKEEIDLEFEVYEEKFNKAVEKLEAEKLEFSKQVEEYKAKVDANEEMVKEVFELIKKIADLEESKPVVPATETKKNVFNAKEWRQEFKADLQKLTK
jgi:hypothetical protein